MRTPLHAILGFAEVMMEERFGPIGNDRYKDYVKDIHASAKHVMSLANDLLDLSKIEAGKLELEFAPVDANRIIRECVSLMQPQAAQERIIMRLSLFDIHDCRKRRKMIAALAAEGMFLFFRPANHGRKSWTPYRSVDSRGQDSIPQADLLMLTGRR